MRNFPFLFLNIDTGDSETENTREKQKTELLAYSIGRDTKNAITLSVSERMTREQYTRETIVELYVLRKKKLEAGAENEK